MLNWLNRFLERLNRKLEARNIEKEERNARLRRQIRNQTRGRK